MIEDNGTRATATPRRRRSPNARTRTAHEPAVDAARPLRGKRRAELNARVLAELQTVRESVDELLERYRIRVIGRITELEQVIQGDAALGQKPRTLTVRESQALLDLLRRTALKPKKGRAKDLERVQKLTRKLRAIR